MSRAERVILTNMCMVYDGDRILVQNKVDDDWTGLCFPGGHVEHRESFVKSVIREIKEETGLTIYEPRLCGVKQVYTEKDERYIVFLYKTNRFEGELVSSEEGEVFWIDRKDLDSYSLAVSFQEMYQVFTSDLTEQFTYLEDGKVVKDLY